MKKLVTVALLLLVLVMGTSYRALGAEEVISMPRTQGILDWLSIPGSALGLIWGACLGSICPQCWIIGAALGALITFCVTFPFEVILSIGSYPCRFVSWTVWNLSQLIDACVPF